MEIDVAEKERLFQEAQEKYFETKSMKDWQSLWPFVIDCCKNIIKSKCYGIVVRDVDEKALDAAMKVLQKIKEGVRVDKLSSYCYLFTIGVIYNKKLQRIDREVDYDLFINDKKYVCENGLSEVFIIEED